MAKKHKDRVDDPMDYNNYSSATITMEALFMLADQALSTNDKVWFKEITDAINILKCTGAISFTYSSGRPAWHREMVAKNPDETRASTGVYLVRARSGMLPVEDDGA